MSKYTLHPDTDHGVPKKEIIRQFFYFLKVLRKNNIFELGSVADVKADARTIKRFGSVSYTHLTLPTKRIV